MARAVSAKLARWSDLARRAEDYVWANPGRPIRQAELCHALSASPSTLVAAFRAVLGTTPCQYVKLRRLALARAALREAPARRGGVKWIALAHGYDHFGGFARDYRAAYGEAPSDTLGASR
jgi:AraC family ethanolamine operon transcriptional activator